MTVVVMAVFLLTFTSCGPFDEPQETISSPFSNDNDNPGKHHDLTDDWTDAGSTHNACMDVLDDSLVNRPPSSFANLEDAIEWTVNMLADHLIDELEYDSTYINPVRRYWLDEGLPTPTRTEFQANVETFIDSLWISTREEEYLNRLSYILCNSEWTETQLDDSLISFRDDVNTIGWYPSEEIIIPMMSIAWYSNDWRHTGFDDSDPPKACDIDWGSVFDADVTGGMTGLVFSLGNPAAAGGSAAVASGIMAIGWLVMD